MEYELRCAYRETANQNDKFQLKWGHDLGAVGPVEYGQQAEETSDCHWNECTGLTKSATRTVLVLWDVFDLPVSDAIAFARELIALAEPLADAYSAATATASEAPASTATASSAAPVGCIIKGRAVDAGAEPGGLRDYPGHPLAGVRVALVRDASGETLAVVGADKKGQFRFIVGRVDNQLGVDPGETKVDLPPDFDPGTESVHLELRLAEAGHSPSRYEVFAPHNFVAQQTRMSSDSLAWETECKFGVAERDFDLGNIPKTYTAWPGVEIWPDLGEVYDRIGRAWALADMLGVKLTAGLPLPIYTFCDWQATSVMAARLLDDPPRLCDTATNVFTSVPTTARTHPTFIAIGSDSTLLTDGGWPDNREYHEFGHFFQAEALGAFPIDPADANHGGYYANPSSTDSWTEGFAEWYSMMVSKHIDEDPRPELYRLEGSQMDLELDYRPWLARGAGEELAVAGVLLDLEDAPADYAIPPAQPSLKVRWWSTYDDPSGKRLLVGEVANVSPAIASYAYAGYSEQTTVAAVFYDSLHRAVHTGYASTVPWDLPDQRWLLAPVGSQERFGIPANVGFFSLTIPDGLSWQSVDVAAFEGRPGESANDDDKVGLGLDEVWRVIESYKSANQDGNGHLFDVSELHDAFRAADGGHDADRNGMDDIDQLFVGHGFFADSNGNLSYDTGETVGLSSHQGRFGEADMTPRHDLPPLPGEMVRVDSGGVPTTVIVEVELAAPNQARSYSYAVQPNADGYVDVAVPPPEYGAVVTLIANAYGYLPAIVGTIQSGTFWSGVDTGKTPPVLSFSVTLRWGTIQPPGDVVPALCVAAGVLLLIVGGWLTSLRRRWPA